MKILKKFIKNKSNNYIRIIHLWEVLYSFVLTLVDKTLDREVEIFEMAFVTDIFDQKDAVESLDEALQLKFVI